MSEYDILFYRMMEESSKAAAFEMLTPIIRILQPNSIYDFGCGEGIWLNVVKSINKDIDILGFDGDHILKSNLKIPDQYFIPCDLARNIRGYKSDLALSIEVAEHIEEQYSDVFIDNITSCSSQVLFSAAIPGQGGIHHVNEQWQEYWIEKFEKRGYNVDFSVRDYFWNNHNITPWRKQNILFFSKEKITLFPNAKPICSIAHPDMFKLKVDNLDNSVFYKKLS